MNSRVTEVFIIETESSLSLNNIEVISDASGLPVIWKNHGQCRLVPKLLIDEYLRAFKMWKAVSERIGGIEYFKHAIYWGDCTVINAVTASLILGEDALNSEHDKPTDEAKS